MGIVKPIWFVWLPRMNSRSIAVLYDLFYFQVWSTFVSPGTLYLGFISVCDLCIMYYVVTVVCINIMSDMCQIWWYRQAPNRRLSIFLALFEALTQYTFPNGEFHCLLSRPGVSVSLFRHFLYLFIVLSPFEPTVIILQIYVSYDEWSWCPCMLMFLQVYNVVLMHGLQFQSQM